MLETDRNQRHAAIIGVGFVCCLMLTPTLVSQEPTFVTNERLTLGTELNRSASVRLADVNLDGNLDVIVANGRHWPQPNYVFINQGRGRFSVMRPLGSDRSTSYACELADFDGDGDMDIATGNDMAPGMIFLNDGTGQFVEHGHFGEISSVRSLTVADIDSDGDIDLLATCRGQENRIYLNDGNASFGPGVTFGTKKDSTIDVAVGDVNADGHQDLILANRDRQPNQVLLNDGHLDFKDAHTFGTGKDQTRAVVVADMNGDGKTDWVTGNIGQPNGVFLGDGKGGVLKTMHFGQNESRTYALATYDLDNDGDIDIIAGNVEQQNAVYFNDGNASEFREVRFGSEGTATYGITAGDVSGDGFADIAVANSGGLNSIFLNRPAGRAPKIKTTAELPSQKQTATPQTPNARATDWPSFRGPGARGVADGFSVRTQWNADPAADLDGVLWQTDVPGLGHSSPVISGNRIYLLTAIASSGEAPLQITAGGRPTAADDHGQQTWVLLCYDKTTGQKLWQKTAFTGKPRATRHAKATHANTSVCVDGDRVVAFLGSEGLYCYDLDGRLLWKQDLGVINISKYGIGWGFASSPAVYENTIVLVCDDPENPFVCARRLSDGEEVWRSSRKDLCERSWSTPLIYADDSTTQVVVNGWPWILSYDLKTGEELWRVKGGGDNPVPTPFEAHGWIYITNAHGAESPIIVVRPGARGDLTPSESGGSSDDIVWSTKRGGCYMSTPVVYGDYLYLGNSNGVVRCFHAKTGEKIYEERLGRGAGLISSLVATDDKIICASENGSVYVLAAGPVFEVLAENKMGTPNLASPAVSEGVIYFRTTEQLIAIEPGE